MNVDYARRIASRKTPPTIVWRAILAGLAVAVILAIVARSFLAPTPGVGATILGIGVGGFIAAKWAKMAGIYQGACVGAGWIALEAFGAVPTSSYSSDALTDTAVVVLIDLATILAGSLGGWLARSEPSSASLDKGRGG
jgi:hypothetical protein